MGAPAENTAAVAAPTGRDRSGGRGAGNDDLPPLGSGGHQEHGGQRVPEAAAAAVAATNEQTRGPRCGAARRPRTSQEWLGTRSSLAVESLDEHEPSPRSDHCSDAPAGAQGAVTLFRAPMSTAPRVVAADWASATERAARARTARMRWTRRTQAMSRTRTAADGHVAAPTDNPGPDPAPGAGVAAPAPRTRAPTDAAAEPTPVAQGGPDD